MKNFFFFNFITPFRIYVADLWVEVMDYYKYRTICNKIKLNDMKMANEMKTQFFNFYITLIPDNANADDW